MIPSSIPNKNYAKPSEVQPKKTICGWSLESWPSELPTSKLPPTRNKGVIASLKNGS